MGRCLCDGEDDDERGAMLAADGDDPAVSTLRKCAKSLIKYFTNNGKTTPPTSFIWNYRVGSPKATRPYMYSPLLSIRVLRCCTGSKDDHHTFLLSKLRGASMGFDCRDQVEGRGLRYYVILDEEY